MANTRYYLVENFLHYNKGILPKKKELATFPVCPWCGADIYIYYDRREWVCSNHGCRLS